MSFLDLFPTKLKILREVHNLSISQIAEFFNFKSKGSVADLESGKAGPTLNTLDDMVDFFGVSLDWLAGKSEIIYREEILNTIEEALQADMVADDPSLNYYQVSTYWIRSCDRYTNRKQVFSLPVRANIIFCMQVLRKSSQIFYEQGTYAEEIDVSCLDGIERSAIERTLGKAKQGVKKIYQQLVDREGKRRANIRWKLCSSCYDYLQDYIRVPDDDERKRTTPVFDVEAAWKDLQGKKEKEGRKQN